jgi:hypothetical protein
VKFFLAAWVAVFACQTAGVAALVAPDDCVELAGNAQDDDPCPDTCPTCVCCARVPASLSPDPVSVAEPPVLASVPPVIDSFSSATPRGILHVPKTR